MTANDHRPDTRIQVWCQNYAPEPQGVAPIAATIARGLNALGNEVSVVTAHPHYPRADWGIRLRPYRELRDGVPVYRLPIWPGRDSGIERIRQDLSSTAAATAAAPFMPRADVVLAISPSLPGLMPAMLQAGLKGIPWVLWLQDIVTEGAVTTGELSVDHPALKAARWFEKHAYSSAAHIIVISAAFRRSLLAAGVPESRISLIHNPMTREPEAATDLSTLAENRPVILAMGNIGRTQGLEPVVEAFEADLELERLGARLVITGDGVAAGSVRERIRGDRVELKGVVSDADLDRFLGSSALALVSQRPGLREFNLPSKLMNYMAHGVPVIASVDSGSEAARIVRESGAGWVTDPADPAGFASRAAEVLQDREGLTRASGLGFTYAREHFSAAGASRAVNEVLAGAIRAGTAP